jgi:hypothetical protein
MKVTIYFTFTESNDHHEPVTLEGDVMSLIPQIGDSVAIRKGYARPVIHRHFLYQADGIDVLIFCK